MRDWKTYKLGDLVTFQRGHDLTVSNIILGPYPIAGSNGIIGHHNSFTTKAPGITIGRSGNIGNAYYYDKNFWAHNTTLYIKEFKNCDPKFIYYLLKTLNFSGHNSGSAVPSLNRNYIHPIEVLAPENIEQQQSIAAILSSLDDKIELNLQMNQIFEAIAQALFKEWFVNDERVSLSKYIELNPRISIKKNTVVKYVEMSNLPESGSSIKSFINRAFVSGSKFQNNDILFARITPCLENGKTGFVDFLNENEAAFGSTEFIVMRAKEGISPYFVYLLARNYNFREFAIKSMVGTSGRQRVQTDLLNSFEISKIDYKKMNEFDLIAKSLFEKIRLNSNENKTLTQIRDNLLPKLMTGKIQLNV